LVDIARARLTQERWFALIRLLLIEAYLFQAQLEPDLGRIFGTRQSVLLLAFGVYALMVVFGVAVRRTWPAAFAYATATVDLAVAIIVTSIWQDGLLNPGLAAVAAAGIAAGVRRFPLFETFIFSFLILVGMPGMPARIKNEKMNVSKRGNRLTPAAIPAAATAARPGFKRPSCQMLVTMMATTRSTVAVA